MQKLKKALKSLTKLGKKTSKPAAKPKAQPAKKASAVKKKTAAAPKKKAPAKKAAAPKKTTAKSAAPTTAKKAAAKTAKPAAPAASKAKGDKAAAKIAKPAAPAVEKKAKAPKAAKVEDVELTQPTTPEPVEAVAQEEEDTEVYLTDADGRRYCRVRDCDQSSAVDGYCRFHYLLLWKKIQVRKKILTEGKLERYIEDLTARYPDKYLEMLKKDLRNEKDFLAAIQELEIDESAGENEFEEEAQNYLDEVRGMSEGGGGDSDRDEY